MILWILELVSYLSVLSRGISFQLVEKPAEIKLIIIPDDFRNFIDRHSYPAGGTGTDFPVSGNDDRK